MIDNKFFRSVIVALRTVILLLLTVGISELSNGIFIYTKHSLFRNDYFPEQIELVWGGIFFFLIFNSLILALNRHSAYTKEKYLKQKKNNKFLSHIKFLFSSADFYVESICIITLSLLLPTDFLFDSTQKMFFANSDLSDDSIKLYTLLIMIPTMFFISLSKHIFLQRKWYKESLVMEYEAPKWFGETLWLTVKSVAFVGAMYCVASSIIFMFIPVFITLWNAGGIKIYLWIIFGIIGIFALRILFCYVRALLKRASFIRTLKKYCKDNSLYISQINKPFKSLVSSYKASDFVVEKNGKKYECKLLAGVFPGTPVIFSDKGGGIKRYHVRFLRVEWTRFSSKFEYDFESEGKKILILVPTPKQFFVSTERFPLALADTGDKVGEYTIYTSTGFLNGLDRDIL